MKKSGSLYESRPVVLGLDFGTKTGFALLDAAGRPVRWGAWKLGSRVSDPTERFRHFRACLDEFHDIPVVGYEDVRFVRSLYQILAWGGLRAIAHVSLAPQVWYPLHIQQIKKFATGKTHADKFAMIDAARVWLASQGHDDVKLDDNMADAIHVARLTYHKCVCDGHLKKMTS